MEPHSDVVRIPYSAHTCRDLLKAAESLIDALRSYTSVATAITESENLDALEKVGDELAISGARFDQAHINHLSLGAPIGDLDLLGLDEDGDSKDCGEEDEASLLNEESAIPISIFTRQDFVVTDVSTLVAAAALSFDEAKDLSIGRVLYELIHRDGRDSLTQREGIVPTASITLFQREETPLGSQTDASKPDYQKLMRPIGETLFSFEELW